VRFDQTTGECWVFTYKEGILSAVAHDLKIRVGVWELTVTREGATGSVSGRFDPASLRVETAMRDGREAPSLLGAKDRAKIEETIRSTVLTVKKHPEIRFASSALESAGDGGWRVEGELTLASRRGRIRAEVRPEGDRLVTEVRIHQPDFGIKPYSAMLGALRIKPEVLVRLVVPAPEAAG